MSTIKIQIDKPVAHQTDEAPLSGPSSPITPPGNPNRYHVISYGAAAATLGRQLVWLLDSTSRQRIIPPPLARESTDRFAAALLAISEATK